MPDMRTELERASRHAPRLGDESFERLVQRRDRKARRVRIEAVALALALTVGVLGIAFAAFLPHSGAGNERPASGPTIDLSVAPNQYSYQRVTTYEYGPTGDGAHWPLYVETAIEQTWYRADGSGRMEDSSHLSFFTPQDRATFLQQLGRSASKQINRHDSSIYHPRGFPTDSGDVAYLSTDPTVLVQQLRARSAVNGSSPEPVPTLSPGMTPVASRVLTSIFNLLSDPNVSPAQKAALFQVAGTLEGVTVVRDAVDLVGRSAIELRVITDRALQQLWFDPASEQMIATKVSDQRSGKVWGVTVVERAGVASSIGNGSALVKSFVPTPATAPPTLPDPRS